MAGFGRRFFGEISSGELTAQRCSEIITPGPGCAGSGVLNTEHVKQQSREQRQRCPEERQGERILLHISGTISSATMLMILISGLTAGPAVSL